MKRVWFTFKKLKSGKAYVCESRNIICLRAKYLHKLKVVRDEIYEVFYLDETHINVHPVWQFKDVKRNMPSGKGKKKT